MSEENITYNKQELIDCHARYAEKMAYDRMLPQMQDLMKALWFNMKRVAEKGVRACSTDLGPRLNEDGTLATGGQADCCFRYLVGQLDRIGQFSYDKRPCHNITLDGVKRCACNPGDMGCRVELTVRWDPATL